MTQSVVWWFSSFDECPSFSSCPRINAVSLGGGHLPHVWRRLTIWFSRVSAPSPHALSNPFGAGHSTLRLSAVSRYGFRIASAWNLAQSAIWSSRKSQCQLFPLLRRQQCRDSAAPDIYFTPLDRRPAHDSERVHHPAVHVTHRRVCGVPIQSKTLAKAC